MNIKIFDKPAPQELTLKLFERGTSSVELYAVDPRGGKLECGRILSVGPNGIARALEVNKDAGLPLDVDGRVKLTDEPLAAVLELIKPFAEYAVKRERYKPGMNDRETFCSLWGYPDEPRLTVGQLRALAAFYEANK